jgi:adenosylhomocysteine nucleosidase
VFALNAEAGALADQLEGQQYAQNATFVERSGTLDQRRVVVAEVGVGAENAARGTVDLLTLHQPKLIISAGFCGGLVDELRKGHLLMAEEIVDAAGYRVPVDLRIDRNALSPGLHIGRLLMVDKVIREPEEKRSLGEQHSALACDLESLAVAEVCRQAGVRFLSVRVVSDTVADRLPIEVEQLLAHKSVAGQLGAAAGAVLNRFSAVGDFWQLYEDALKCSQRLARFLRGVIREAVPVATEA